MNISGRSKVKTIKKEFKDEFGLTIRVYDGNKFADDDATIASLREGGKIKGEFSPQKNMKVGSFEDRMKTDFGLKVQIAGSDDSYLCDDNLTLSKALEKDEKRMAKRSKQKEETKNVEKQNQDAGSDSNETNDLSPEQKSFLEGWFSSWHFQDEEEVPKEWLSSKAFMLGAVKSQGSVLEYASEELKSDREIVLEAVKSDASAFEYASERFKSDREFVLEAVKSEGSALKHASESLKSDRKVVLEAVKTEGSALEYASDELKSDRELVLVAVNSSGNALQHVPEQMLKSLAFIKDLCEILDWKEVLGSIPNHVLETEDKTYIDFFEVKCKEGIEDFRNEINNLKLDSNEPGEYKNNLENIYKRHIPCDNYYQSIFRWDGKINFNEGAILYNGEDSVYEVLCNEFYQNIWQPAMEGAELPELVKFIPHTILINKYTFMPNRELSEWGYQRVIDFLDEGEELSLEQLVELLNAEEEFFHLSSDLPEVHERLVEELFKHSFQDIFDEILYNEYHWARSIFTKNKDRLEEYIEWIRETISSTNDDKYEYPLENLLEWLEEAEEY